VETGRLPPHRIGKMLDHRAAVEELSNSNFQIWDRFAGLKARRPTICAASFSPELVDLCIYCDRCSRPGDKIPRKGGPGITRSTCWWIKSKSDSCLHMVGGQTGVRQRDTRRHAWPVDLVLHQTCAVARGLQQVRGLSCGANYEIHP